MGAGSASRRWEGTQAGRPVSISPSPTPGLHYPSTQEVDAAEIQVQVCLYAFDLIYLNGEVSPASRQSAAKR